MSLRKAIKFGKERRKEYTGAERVYKSCRCHGSCSYCRLNRLYSSLKREKEAEEEIAEWKEREAQFLFGYEAYMDNFEFRYAIYLNGEDYLQGYSEDFIEGVNRAKELLMLKYESEIEAVYDFFCGTEMSVL